MMARYKSVNGPALAVGFSDDAFATAKGMRRLLDAFPCLLTEMMVISPADVELRSVALWVLSTRRRVLWPKVFPFVVPLREPQVSAARFT